MMKRLAVTLAVLAAPLMHAESNHAAVVDDRALRLVDLSGKTPVQTIRLAEGRQHVVFSRDGSRLMVFSVPESGKATVTFVDTATLAPAGTIELGRGINDVLPYGDDRMYVLTREAPAELWDIDVRSGKSVQHRVFDRDARELDLMPDGKTAIVYMPGDAKRVAEMRFIDRATLEQATTVKLSAGAGAPVAFRNSQQFYSIDPAGKIFFLSTPDHALVGSLDVGRDAKIAAIQPGMNRIFVTSHDANREGYVHVIRNAEHEKTLTVNFEPLFLDLAADAKTGTVSGRSFRGVAGIHQMREASIDLSDLESGSADVTQLRTFADAKQQGVETVSRALDRCCNDVTMEHTMKIADRIGRTAEVLGEGRTASILVAGAIIGGIFTSVGTEERIPAHVSDPTLFTDYYESQHGDAIAAGGYFARGDGQFAYELDNHEHLFVRRTSDRRRVAKIDVDDGLQEMVVLGNERTLAVVGDDRVAIVDTQSNQRTGYFKAGGDVLGVAVSPDRNFGAVIGEDKVSIIDGDRNQVRYVFRDIRGRAQVIFLP